MSDRNLNKAIKNHRMWHERDHDNVVRRSSTALDAKVFCEVGRAVNIIYESDKWYGRKEKTYLYDHDFDSHPGVFKPCKCRDGECRQVSREKLLGVTGKQLPTTELGTVETFTIDVDGEHEVFDFNKRVYLYSTPDLKALVIPHGNSVFVVRGGQMRVTARGIVK